MNLSLTKKLIGSLSLLALLTATLFFISCQKDLTADTGTNSGLPPDLSTKISSSVSGFVTDENNAPVKGANVKAGTATTTTDKYGYFEILNTQVVQNAAVVTVNQPGYFKGIKTYIARTGKPAFFRIKLIPKTVAGNINASAGGAVTLTNGLSISVPANAVVNAATGAVYNGTINVAAYWLDPTSADLNNIMPGDLRGINDAGLLKGLTTFGMAAVELTGASGELLQIATGKKATLTLSIPATLLSKAPSSIPLWYFDEALGLWKQQGAAVKTGNTYIGDVSHFSFWNCDTPGSYVQFDCTVLNSNNTPLQNVLVKISVVNNPYNSAVGYTNSAGFVSGPVPDNQVLLLEVFSSLTCQIQPMYSQTFTTTNTNISLGNLIVQNSPNNYIASITGNVTNCSNNPVTDGRVLIKNGYQYYTTPVSNGSFNVSIPFCSNNISADLIAQDFTTLQESNTTTINLISGNNNIGTLNACGTSIVQFLNYSVNGANYSLAFPADNIYQSGYTYINTINYVSAYNNTLGANLYMIQQNIAVGVPQDLESFHCSQIPDSLISTPPLKVNITEYGAIGQYMSGNFAGVLHGYLNPTNYTITCSFRVKRTF